MAARWAHQTVEGAACGMDRGTPRRDFGAMWCGLVAAEMWRLLVRLETQCKVGGRRAA